MKPEQVLLHSRLWVCFYCHSPFYNEFKIVDFLGPGLHHCHIRFLLIHRNEILLKVSVVCAHNLRNTGPQFYTQTSKVFAFLHLYGLSYGKQQLTYSTLNILKLDTCRKQIVLCFQDSRQRNMFYSGGQKNIFFVVLYIVSIFSLKHRRSEFTVLVLIFLFFRETLKTLQLQSCYSSACKPTHAQKGSACARYTRFFP